MMGAFPKFVCLALLLAAPVDRLSLQRDSDNDVDSMSAATVGAINDARQQINDILTEMGEKPIAFESEPLPAERTARIGEIKDRVVFLEAATREVVAKRQGPVLADLYYNHIIEYNEYRSKTKKLKEASLIAKEVAVTQWKTESKTESCYKMDQGDFIATMVFPNGTDVEETTKRLVAEYDSIEATQYEEMRARLAQFVTGKVEPGAVNLVEDDDETEEQDAPADEGDDDKPHSHHKHAISQKRRMKAEGDKDKIVYFIRHADDLCNRDGDLTRVGKTQAAKLAELPELKDVEMVISSPAGNCLETALIAFEGTKIEVNKDLLDSHGWVNRKVGMDLCVEYMRSDVLKNYGEFWKVDPTVGFEDTMSDIVRTNDQFIETKEGVHARFPQFKEYLARLPYKKIVVMTHKHFLQIGFPEYNIRKGEGIAVRMTDNQIVVKKKQPGNWINDKGFGHTE